jgi:S1-C subfamily serine protease
MFDYAATLCRLGRGVGLGIALALTTIGLGPLAWAQSPLDSVVGVRAAIPADARTAEVLGTEREGSGVVIGADGLVLTIGYLILEAASAEIALSGGLTIPADIVAYDYETGFGLLRPITDSGVRPIELGDSAKLAVENPVMVASFGGAEGPPSDASAAFVVSRRAFAGYWEYLLPEAIFTAPPHPTFGGAALIGPDGRLLGIGSLFVGDAAQPGGRMAGNMFVPIDALKPILDDLVAHGRAQGPRRPWLGVFTEEMRGYLFVNRVAGGGPAAAAGIEPNQVILAVDGEPVQGMADFYRKVWALGQPGVVVPLTVLTEHGVAERTVTSGDRYNYLKLDPSY